VAAGSAGCGATAGPPPAQFAVHRRAAQRVKRSKPQRRPSDCGMKRYAAAVAFHSYTIRLIDLPQAGSEPPSRRRGAREWHRLFHVSLPQQEAEKASSWWAYCVCSKEG